MDTVLWGTGNSSQENQLQSGGGNMMNRQRRTGAAAVKDIPF